MTLPTSQAVFAVRIVSCDNYTAPPLKNFDPSTSEFRRSPVKQAPVIRIFGSTPAGKDVFGETFQLFFCSALSFQARNAASISTDTFHTFVYRRRFKRLRRTF